MQKDYVSFIMQKHLRYSTAVVSYQMLGKLDLFEKDIRIIQKILLGTKLVACG